MKQTLGYISYLVRDYDEAIAFFTKTLNFTLIEDTILSETKRWVLVAPPGSSGTCLLLARAATPEQESRIGNQTGGGVFLFLHTDNFPRDYDAMKAKGVKFITEPRHESYGIVAVFEDLYQVGFVGIVFNMTCAEHMHFWLLWQRPFLESHHSFSLLRCNNTPFNFVSSAE